MANGTNSFTSLLSALGNPPGYSFLKLQRTLRTKVIDTKDWAANVPEIEEILKDLSTIPHRSRNPRWHARVAKLTLIALNQAAKLAARDPFVELARGMDHTAKVLELRRIYRKEIGGTEHKRWLDIPKEVRDQIEEEVIERVILPDDARGALKVKQRIRGMVNEAGNKIMISSRVAQRKRRREMEAVSYEDNSNITEEEGEDVEEVDRPAQHPDETRPCRRIRLRARLEDSEESDLSGVEREELGSAEDAEVDPSGRQSAGMENSERIENSPGSDTHGEVHQQSPGGEHSGGDNHRSRSPEEDEEPPSDMPSGGDDGETRAAEESRTETEAREETGTRRGWRVESEEAEMISVTLNEGLSMARAKKITVHFD